MSSIALIGPDGAGKTTVARMLEQSGILPIKYLYMGINTSSSNLALPTSRLVEYLKPRLVRAGSRSPSRANPASTKPTGPGMAWRSARLVNRLAEEWFRQVVSWSWEFRGYIVLHDRHFLFDFAPELAPAGDGPEPLDHRLHRWFLAHLYPRPKLVILLDAPGAVLFARKGESTPEELERRRQGLLRLGRVTPGFVRIDATRPLDEVFAEAAAHVAASHGQNPASHGQNPPRGRNPESRGPAQTPGRPTAPSGSRAAGGGGS